MSAVAALQKPAKDAAEFFANKKRRGFKKFNANWVDAAAVSRDVHVYVGLLTDCFACLKPSITHTVHSMQRRSCSFFHSRRRPYRTTTTSDYSQYHHHVLVRSRGRWRYDTPHGADCHRSTNLGIGRRSQCG